MFNVYVLGISLECQGYFFEPLPEITPIVKKSLC